MKLKLDVFVKFTTQSKRLIGVSLELFIWRVVCIERNMKLAVYQNTYIVHSSFQNFRRRAVSIIIDLRIK